MIKRVTFLLLVMVLVGISYASADTPVTTVTRTTFTTGQVALTTNAAIIVAATPARASVTICNHSSTVDVYIGRSTVATNTGFRVQANTCFTIDRTSAAIYGVTASSATVSYWQE